MAAPTASTARVVRTMPRRARPTSVIMGRSKTSRSRLPSRTPIPRPSSRLRVAVSDMMPRPPSWISSRITVRPKRVNPAPVSRTISPVTHTALVEVNRASRKLMGWSGGVARGSIRRPEPTRINEAKMSTKDAAGRTLRLAKRRCRWGSSTANTPTM